MLSQRVIALAALAALAAACSGDPAPPGPLDIGMRDQASGEFVALTDDIALPVLLGANGLNMIVPSLRAADIDPSGPDPSITVSVAGILMAADIKGDAVDMEDDGEGFVLWDLRVPFRTDLCCYNCVEGTVFAQLEDRTGHMFEGEVTVVLSRNGTCPDDSVCCGDVDACPAGLTQVCE